MSVRHHYYISTFLPCAQFCHTQTSHKRSNGELWVLAFCHLLPSLPASQHIGSSSSTASSDTYHPFHRCSSWWPKLYGDNCRLHCKYFFSRSLLIMTVSSLIFSNYSERAHPSCPTWPQGLFQVTAYDSPVCVSSFFRHIYKSTGCRHLVDFPSSLCPHGVNSLHDSSTTSLCILTHRRQRAIKSYHCWMAFYRELL